MSSWSRSPMSNPMPIDIRILYPRNPKNEFRWAAVPADAKVAEHNLSPKWLDLVWWCERRTLWVYITTRENNAKENHAG